MLAVTANWGIGDGSLADSRAARAAAWLDAIRRVIVRAGWGTDGRYRPVGEVTLIFAGDTFEWLLSDRWAGRDRPWHGGARGEQARNGVVAASLQAARPVLRTLSRWARAGLPVPVATPRERPSEWAVQAVQVRPILLAGDRDSWLIDHAAAAGRFGIATGEEWSDGRRQVRHGHDLDPMTHRTPSATGRSGRPPTLAESLVTDLVVPFAVAIRGDAEAWRLIRPSLASLSAASPSRWPAILAAAAAADAGRVATGSCWRRAVAGWHRTAARELPTCETEFDALGELAAWLDGMPAGAPVPEAVRRLDVAAAGASGERVITADHSRAESPTLSCHESDRAICAEPLGWPQPAPAVVAIGAGAAGGGFIDAA